MPQRFRDFYLRHNTYCFRILFILQRVTFLVRAYSVAEIKAFTAVVLGCGGRAISVSSLAFCVGTIVQRWRRPQGVNVRQVPLRYCCLLQ